MAIVAEAQKKQQTIDRAIGSVAALATLPETTVQIIKTVEDPRSTAQQLNKIISHDPALVSRVLKVVNSAFYGLPGQIASMERAIVLLGLNAVKNIAVAASLGQLFRGTKLTDQYTAKDLWLHCVGVAVAARDLAKRQKLPIADEAFLAGMIHDIGLLIELQVWPEQVQDVCKQASMSDRPFVQIERDLLGVDHQQMGAALTGKWQFPKSCQLIAGNHHQPTRLEPSVKTLAALIHAADHICGDLPIGFPLTVAHEALQSDFIESAGITAASIAATKERMPELMSAASALLA